MRKEIPPAPSKGKLWYTMILVRTKRQYLCECIFILMHNVSCCIISKLKTACIKIRTKTVCIPNCAVIVFNSYHST